MTDNIQPHFITESRDSNQIGLFKDEVIQSIQIWSRAKSKDVSVNTSTQHHMILQSQNVRESQ